MPFLVEFFSSELLSESDACAFLLIIPSFSLLELGILIGSEIDLLHGCGSIVCVFLANFLVVDLRPLKGVGLWDAFRFGQRLKPANSPVIGPS
jgi:hypothetical protein